MAAQSPTVVFFPEGAFGPTNNCVGIADVLRRRGARVIFVVEESFAGTLAARGFEEALMRLKPRPEVPEEPGQFWKDFIRDTAPHFRRSTLDQLETLIKPMVVLPLFWDQHDNAQRVHEMGFGARLPSYTFTDDDFFRAIETLLADQALHARLQGIAARLQAQPGTHTAAALIEQIAREKQL